MTKFTREETSTGWFVGIIVALALLAIGYLVFASATPAAAAVSQTTTIEQLETYHDRMVTAAVATPALPEASPGTCVDTGTAALAASDIEVMKQYSMELVVFQDNGDGSAKVVIEDVSATDPTKRYVITDFYFKETDTGIKGWCWSGVQIYSSSY